MEIRLNSGSLCEAWNDETEEDNAHQKVYEIALRFLLISHSNALLVFLYLCTIYYSHQKNDISSNFAMKR